MSEFMGKVTAVNADETIEVSLLSGGYKTKTKKCEAWGFDQKVLARNRKGQAVRRPSGLAIQFMWGDVKNGPVKVGDTVMVEMQPVQRPVRKI